MYLGIEAPRTGFPFLPLTLYEGYAQLRAAQGWLRAAQGSVLGLPCSQPDTPGQPDFWSAGWLHMGYEEWERSQYYWVGTKSYAEAEPLKVHLLGELLLIATPIWDLIARYTPQHRPHAIRHYLNPSERLFLKTFVSLYLYVALVWHEVGASIISCL